jgi:hypothetical protein
MLNGTSFEGAVRIGGRGSRCTVASSNLFVKEANIETHADKEDTSNFESNGTTSATIGLDEATGDTRGDWDAGLNRFAAGIYPRDDLPQTYFINVADGASWNFTYSVVLSAKTAIPARSLISFDWNWCSNGPYGVPGGGQE